jgi:hypothetical protein
MAELRQNGTVRRQHERMERENMEKERPRLQIKTPGLPPFPRTPRRATGAGEVMRPANDGDLPRSLLLAAYSSDAGGWSETTEAVCVAREGRSARGGLCGSPAVCRIAGIDVCVEHFRLLERWNFDDTERKAEQCEAVEFRRTCARVRAAAADLREANRDYVRTVEEMWQRREEVLAQQSVVYYLRRVSDGMIKIGTSARFRTRLAQHRKIHGELQILLIRGGSRDEEADAHAKYRYYRPDRMEWFYPAQPVLRSLYRYRQSWLAEGLQPDDALPMEDFKMLVREAPPRKILQWDDEGVLLWPPVAEAAA